MEKITKKGLKEYVKKLQVENWKQIKLYLKTFIQCYWWWQGGQQVEGVVVVHKDGIPIESSMEKSLTVEVSKLWSIVNCESARRRLNKEKVLAEGPLRAL